MQQIKVSYFLTRALQMVGVVAEGSTPSPQMLNDALYTLNEELDYWNADGDMIYSMETIVAPLANGIQQSDGTTIFTIGPAYANGALPSIVTDIRPVNLEWASYRMTNVTPVLDIPIRILSESEYGSLRIKSLQTTVSYYMYMDAQFPVANIYLFPMPSISASLYLQYWQPLNSALTLNSTFSMPPAYAKGLRYAVACSVAPEYRKPIPPDIAAELAAIKRKIAVTNKRGSRLVYEGAAQGTSAGGGAYDVLTDQVY